MLLHADNLKHYSLHASDGEIGSLADLYFDDEKWTVRYFVADTGPLFLGKRVLISPASVEEPIPDDKTLRVSLTVEEVKGSPEIDLQKPVSRQEEERFYSYYNLMPYWEGPDIWADSAYARGLPVLRDPGGREREDLLEDQAREARARSRQENHIRSCNELEGYRLSAIDGKVGKVKDFLIEDKTWAIRYFIIDTGSWLSGKKVVVSPDWIDEVRWPEKLVAVGLNKEAIRGAPEYNPAAEVKRDFEEETYEHYNARRYWK